MRRRPHHHPCDSCGTKTECCGEVLQDYDGDTEWWCDEYYHIVNCRRVRRDFVCEGCETARESCAYCNAEPQTKEHEPYGSARCAAQASED